MRRRDSGQAIMLIMMGVMLIGGLVVWVTRGDIHMMPMHGSGHSHGKTGAASPIHDTHGNAPDQTADRRGADPEHVIEEGPILDNP